MRLIDAFRSGGEAAIIGRKGFYELDAWRRDKVWIPVTVKGMEMRGCTPVITVTPVGGVGDIDLDSPCQFVDSKKDVKRIEQEREEETRRAGIRERLNAGTTVGAKRSNLDQFIHDHVEGGWGHPTLQEELTADGKQDADSIVIPSHHIQKYRSIAWGLAFPSDEE